MRVLEAVRTATQPRPIPPELIEWRAAGKDEHPVVEEVEHWVGRAAEELRTFAELGAPWAAHE
jgi:hypothetical protein